MRVATQSRDASVEGDGGVERTYFDFLDPSTFGPAVRGCSALFLMRPPAIARTRNTLCKLIDVAGSEGVEHIVFLSVAGADRNVIVPHHAVETHLARTATSWTILRPGFFAQNLADAYRRDIVEDDRIYVPAGRGRVAFVDARDIGDVAAEAFCNPARHRGRGYTLTGPHAHDFAEVASMLTHALGRGVRYEPASVGGYAAHLWRRGLPLPQVMVQTTLHVGLRFGQAQRIEQTIETLLHRAPRPLERYIGENVEVWGQPQAGLVCSSRAPHDDACISSGGTCAGHAAPVGGRDGRGAHVDRCWC